jgi:hypothetical protein
MYTYDIMIYCMAETNLNDAYILKVEKFRKLILLHHENIVQNKILRKLKLYMPHSVTTKNTLPLVCFVVIYVANMRVSELLSFFVKQYICIFLILDRPSKR